MEFDLVALESDPHVFLFLFVPAEDADLGKLGAEKPVQNGVPERSGAAGDEQNFVFEHATTLSNQAG
jgi:hypothetical protein